MNERQESVSNFIVARSDASELLDAAEEALDQIVALVDMRVERTRVESVGTWRDQRLTALLGNGCHQAIRIVALVSHDELG